MLKKQTKVNILRLQMLEILMRPLMVHNIQNCTVFPSMTWYATNSIHSMFLGVAKHAVNTWKRKIQAVVVEGHVP